MNKSQYTMLMIRKDPKQFLASKWRLMRDRVLNKNGDHGCYDGLDVLDRSDFIEWAMSDDAFESMYTDYAASNFDKKLVPTIDRIDTSIGYVIGNMRFVSYSKNSTDANVKKWKIKRPCGKIEIVENMSEYCRVNGLSRGTLRQTLITPEKRSHHKGFKVLGYADY